MRTDPQLGAGLQPQRHHLHGSRSRSGPHASSQPQLSAHLLPGNRCLIASASRSPRGELQQLSDGWGGPWLWLGTTPRQRGLGRRSRVCFELVGDHIELRPWKPQQDLPESGFGLLKSQRPPVPVDFDPASLLRP